MQNEDSILKTMRAKNFPKDAQYYVDAIQKAIEDAEYIIPSDTSQAPYKELTVHFDAVPGGYWDLSTGLTGKDYYIALNGEEAWNNLSEENKQVQNSINYDYQVLGTIGGPVIQKEIYIKDFDDELTATMIPRKVSALTIGEEFSYTNTDGEYFPEGYKEAYTNLTLATSRSSCINAGTKTVGDKTYSYAGGDGGNIGENGKQGENNGEEGTSPITNQVKTIPSEKTEGWGQIIFTLNKGGDGGRPSSYYDYGGYYQDKSVALPYVKPYTDNLFKYSSVAGKGKDGCVFSTGWGGVGEISLKIHVGNDNAFKYWVERYGGKEELYNWLCPNYSLFFSGALNSNTGTITNKTSMPESRECGYPILFIYYS